MKKTKIIYWTTTILFAAFMGLTAIPDIMMAPDAIVFMTHLGYPTYFIPFIGVAKVLGCIAILIPGFPKIKEWAYAGLAFDLIGALFSIISVEGLQPSVSFMVLPLVLMAVSYSFNNKMQSAQAV